MIGSANLTRAEGQPNLSQTVQGMAHFAGTGPQDKRCRQCKFWYSLTKAGHKLTSDNSKRPCHKYKELIVDPVDRRIPPLSPACKYFEAVT